MRTHVWRKQLLRLSQRGQRLPFQRRRAFHSAARHLEAHPNPGPSASASQETANLEAQSSEGANKAAPSSRRSARYARRPKEVAPFAIPDWFLRHNVRLHAPTTDAKDRDARCWTLVDKHSGHTVLTLPFTTASGDPSTDLFSPTAERKEDRTATPSNIESKVEEAEPRPKEGEVESSSKEKQATFSPKDKGALDDSDIARAVDHLSPTPPVQSPDPRLLLSLQLQLLLHAAFSHVGPQSARFQKSNIDLNTRDKHAHKDLDVYVNQIANLVGADLIQLDANDFADLGQDYVEPHDHAPGSISSLAYDTFKGHVADNRSPHILHIDIVDDLPSEEGQDDGESDQPAADFPSIEGLADWVKNNSPALQKALSQAGGAGVIPIAMSEMPKSRDESSSAGPQSRAANISTWDELKLATLLDTIMDSVQIKKDSPVQDTPNSFLYEPIPPTTDAAAPCPPTQDGLERFLADFLAKHIDSGNQAHNLHWKFEDTSPSSESVQPRQRTIVHVRDMDHIRNESQGETIINRLVRVVQRRRKDGEQIVILGTTAGSTQSPPHPALDDDELYFRYVQWPYPSSAVQTVGHMLNAPPHVQQRQERSVAEPGYHRLFDINMRHIHAMVRRLGIPVSDNFFAPDTRSHLNIPGTFKLGDRTLPHDEIQRIVICADSLRSLYTDSPSLETFHIALAAMLANTVDTALSSQIRSNPFDSVIPPARPRGSSKGESDRADGAASSKLNMEKLKKSCSKHETRLLSGVVDPASLRTTFNDVHADPSTIESLKTLTSLTLLRPEAFSYGILAADRLPGLLLYGPPGTGKTLLAKAVAKESSATVLEVSGAQVYEKYVGEGEKMVKAVFSLAKKLSPCVVFIDEADALFGSRGGANNRTTHREIINQFLREWDGMDDHSVFMMVATNRPFDLDDAVLRRLPRRLLVDLPLVKDREGILKIHLKDETLDSTVSLSDLAKNTPLYSGSDLKNLCVAAALAAVRDENNALEAARAKGDKEFKLPARRTLAPSHFEKALQEISASVSEDMATLGAIRKFDEQYGERRARTKKAGYGFGLGASNAIDETGARVRPDEPSR